MEIEEWEETVPRAIREDPLWRVRAYRLALFIADLGWQDITLLAEDRRTVSIADQLCRALGSISANIEEGYSRGTGKDRARFYEYALGSARESRGWYYRSRHVLGDMTVQNRLSLLTEVIRLLMTMVPEQRSSGLHEEPAIYSTDEE